MHRDVTRIWRKWRKREPSYILQYTQILRRAGREFGNPPLGEKFASQLVAERTAVAAGLFVVDYKSHTYNKEWLESPVISKLIAQPLSPTECAAEEAGAACFGEGNGSGLLSMAPLSLETIRETKARILSKVLEWKRGLSTS